MNGNTHRTNVPHSVFFFTIVGSAGVARAITRCCISQNMLPWINEWMTDWMDWMNNSLACRTWHIIWFGLFVWIELDDKSSAKCKFRVIAQFKSVCVPACVSVSSEITLFLSQLFPELQRVTNCVMRLWFDHVDKKKVTANVFFLFHWNSIRKNFPSRSKSSVRCWLWCGAHIVNRFENHGST